MMKRSILSILILFLSFQYISAASDPPAWGFFGHRLINRMAVFTLPPEMISFYKANIEYLTEHAVDPDKRRYAARLEAARHYMDMDQFGYYPFESLPRTWYPFLATYANVYVVLDDKDTVRVMGEGVWRGSNKEYKVISDSLLALLDTQYYRVPLRDMHQFVAFSINKAYRHDEWEFSRDSLKGIFPNAAFLSRVTKVFGNASFSEHGLLPYNLDEMFNRLVKAFVAMDKNAILRLSAELGHYIGDAHVPLHTTKNYNGQLTNQDGIHAFWESRIPELFADEEFDFLVGKAQFIKETNDYFWKVIFDSNEGVKLVLDIENNLKKSFPEDQQFCYENRLQQVIRTQCRDFAKAYMVALDGQVEDRMREAIISVGNIWYTAWVTAGQPDLKLLKDAQLSAQEQADQEELEKKFQQGKGYGRNHE